MAYLIGIYILVIAMEAIYSHRKRLGVYRFAETVGHFGTGVGQQVFNVFWFSGLAVIYQFLLDHLALFQIPRSSWAGWVAAFLMTEFCWYWSHRASHRINFFIASHAVHHQARDFNHGSALRQSWTSRPVVFLFFAPLAVLGIPVEMLLGTQVLTAFLQFFTHNGVITRRLGWLERVFVTPRTHRVHHGINTPYLDRNFGGVLIVFDRFFGTYADLDERVPVRIGSLDRVNPYDAFDSNLDYYRRMLFASSRQASLGAKLRVWFGSPEHLASELQRLGYEEREQPSEVRYSELDRPTLFALITLSTVAVAFLMKNALALGWSSRIGLGAFILALIWAIGRVLDRRKTPLTTKQVA